LSQFFIVSCFVFFSLRFSLFDANAFDKKDKQRLIWLFMKTRTLVKKQKFEKSLTNEWPSQQRRRSKLRETNGRAKKAKELEWC
jgi:hypothetical protein